MRATIELPATLLITPESQIEAYALAKWMAEWKPVRDEGESIIRIDMTNFPEIPINE